ESDSRSGRSRSVATLQDGVPRLVSKERSAARFIRPLREPRRLHMDAARRRQAGEITVARARPRDSGPAFRARGRALQVGWALLPFRAECDRPFAAVSWTRHARLRLARLREL